jgi:translation initiation factor 1
MLGRVARSSTPLPPRAPRGDGIARVRREVAGRRGKPVTTVHDLGLSSDALRELASELKRMCGSGGTAKDGVIEIQGDHVERVMEALRARGFTVRRSGG